jgi:hypothetical protein
VNPDVRRSFSALLGGGLLVVALAGCGSSGSEPGSSALAPVRASAAPSTAAAPTPGSGVIAPAGASLSAEQVSDSGLASKVGAGKLSKPTIKALAQFFEDKVGNAYATGHPDELDHYLAGPMLSGNRATINLLAGKHKRDVFKIRVETVKPQTNEAHHVIFTMTADMTLDYFFNPQTKKILDGGLPGPSQVSFTMFFDQNPKTHTWYWTGEQSAASAGASGSGPGSGAG